MKSGHFDLRNILLLPSIYRLFSYIVAPGKTYSIVTNDYIKPRKGDRILDIGCGVGRILSFFPKVEYLGMDMNRQYIKAAIKQFGDRGTFIYGNVSEGPVRKFSDYDIILALGILHHLDDREASQLFRTAKGALKIGGRLITFDGCYVENQSGLVRYILSRDRGRYVRTRDEYRALASGVFTKIKEDIRNDLIFLPYTHIILQCTA